MCICTLVFTWPGVALHTAWHPGTTPPTPLFPPLPTPVAPQLKAEKERAEKEKLMKVATAKQPKRMDEEQKVGGWVCVVGVCVV